MRRQHNRFGFTLVELLVIIGIIAVLMAILMPTLARARQTAKTIQCGSNLRQIDMALQMYIGDNRGWYPSPGWIARQYQQMSAGRPVPPSWAGPFPYSTPPVFDEKYLMEGGLAPYLKGGLDIFRCPSHEEPWNGTAQVVSYHMNGGVGGYGHRDSYKANQFEADVVIFVCTKDKGTYNVNNPLWCADNDFSFLPINGEGVSERHIQSHGPGGYILRANHSAEFISHREYVVEATKERESNLRGNWWCSPQTSHGRGVND
ncbi:MAG: type II secretion system GspH family protein [bacterium]|nr:type II secretion system GspH family protein [bacterium]